MWYGNLKTTFIKELRGVNTIFSLSKVSILDSCLQSLTLCLQ